MVVVLVPVAAVVVAVVVVVLAVVVVGVRDRAAVAVGLVVEMRAPHQNHKEVLGRTIALVGLDLRFGLL